LVRGAGLESSAEKAAGSNSSGMSGL
jgi:hypothetical protein